MYWDEKRQTITTEIPVPPVRPQYRACITQYHTVLCELRNGQLIALEDSSPVVEP